MCPMLMTKKKRRASEGFVPLTFRIGRRSSSPVDEIADLAAAEIEHENFDAADKLLGEGLAQDPDHADCQAFQAICLAARGRDNNSAEEMARAVMRNHPGNPVGWFALGHVHLLGGRRGAAFQFFAQAREMANRDRKVRGRLDRCDPRRASVFSSLPRNHFLNIVGGRLRSVMVRLRLC